MAGSYGGNNNEHRIHDVDEPNYHGDERPQSEQVSRNEQQEEEYKVDWGSSSDPMNPRSKSKVRKWIIVLIISSCSLCV
jgi:hypothetical protein